MPTSNEQSIINHIFRTRLIHQNLVNHMVSQDEALFDLARQRQGQGQLAGQRRRVVEPLNHSRPRNRSGTYFETRGTSDAPMAWMANLFDNSGNFVTNTNNQETGNPLQNDTNTTEWHRFGNWNILGAAPSQFGDQRRQTNIWNTFNPFTDLPNLFGAFQRTNEPINRGLTDQEMSDALWVGNYNDVNNPINTMCPITTYEFQPDTEVAMINHCRHIFCSAALRRWFATHSTCPVCRYDIHSRTTTTTRNNDIRPSSDNRPQTEADNADADIVDDNADHNSSTSYTIQWHVEPIGMNGDTSGNTIHRSTIRTIDLEQGLDQFLREYIGITSNNGTMDGGANGNTNVNGDRNDNSEQNGTSIDNNPDEMFTRLLTETLSSISNGIRTLDRLDRSNGNGNGNGNGNSNINSIYDVSGNHMEHPGLM